MNAQIIYVAGLITATVCAFFLSMSVAFVTLPNILATSLDKVLALQS